jgi:L-asparaginase II
MTNPVLVHVMRGGIVESRHRGAFAVVEASGGIAVAVGDIAQPVFPRSAIKSLQALPMVELAAERFGFTDREIALACASHSGEPEHVQVARGMLEKIGLSEDDLECGPHWPYDAAAQRALVESAQWPGRAHNNCSGKHAGMLALALALGADPKGYTQPSHPVQRTIASVLRDLCGVDPSVQPCGTDGCSVPTWALPLKAQAHGFAKLVSGSGSGLAPERQRAARRIIAAVRAHPFLVAGTERFCTRLMQAVPRAFVKTGAEGVFCAAVPHTGHGLAVKCDDGSGRAAETIMAALLAHLPVWTSDEQARLRSFAAVPLTNWAGIEVGEIRAVEAAFPPVTLAA